MSMTSINIIAFILAFLLSLGATIFVRRLALRLGVIDRPDKSRKRHKANTPLLGGIAIYASFFIIVFIFISKLTERELELNHWFGFLVGGFFLLLGGFLDDKYDLSPKYQIIFPILAGFSVIIGGVGIEKITNPVGEGFIYLNKLNIQIFAAQTQIYYFTVFSDILIVVWLLGMMFTTKLLDGVDGLVTGITAIGGFIIFLFTMTTMYFQPDIGLASLILAGACLGFLVFNWSPAKIFLGEGGSLLLGYLLGVLAIISGGKIAIALLVMGLPILDLFWTVIRRLLAGKNPFLISDREHLHFRLLDLGLGARKTVFIFYGFSLLFGLSALFLQGLGKLIALFFLVVIMLVVVVVLNILHNKKIKYEN